MNILEKLAPDLESKFRNKIRTQIGISQDLADSYGGSPKIYLKKFNKVNRDKIRMLQLGVGKGLEKKFSDLRQSKRPTMLRTAA